MKDKKRKAALAAAALLVLAATVYAGADNATGGGTTTGRGSLTGGREVSALGVENGLPRIQSEAELKKMLEEGIKHYDDVVEDTMGGWQHAYKQRWERRQCGRAGVYRSV